MRVALCIEYDGHGFNGWQSQREGHTVQDALEKALSDVAAEKIRVICAGRTDAGVHATAQVVHFDCDANRPLSAWVRGTNARLAERVAVRWAQAVPDDFHARFAARSRSYRYLLLNRGERPGLLAGRVGWTHKPLDVEVMRAAAVSLVGEHDFSTFRAAECQAKSPVRTLHRLGVERHGDLVVFDFHANAFLHHMVRNIVGALVYVGVGRQPVSWLAEVLAARNRGLSAPTFSADGLYLTGVEYESHWGLPQGGRIMSYPTLW